MTRRPPGGPRIPTALLVAGTVVLLAGATWLFLADGGGTDEPRTADPAPQREQAEGVLDLPDDEEPADSRRRGGDGRDRLDEDEVAPDDEEAEDGSDLPAIATNLEGVRVAIGAASAPAEGDATRRVAIGDLRVRCAAAVDESLAAREVLVVEELAQLVQRAGGRVVRVDDPPACVDERVGRLEGAALGIVVTLGERALVAPGRPEGARGDRASSLLAAGVAAVLDAPVASGEDLTAARRRATAAGAIDRPGGGAVAWVEVTEPPDRDGLRLLARDLLEGLAATAARADVSAG